jgi:hypothetical protein
MASILSADNGTVSGSAGLKSTADSSGILALQTGANTTAVTIDASQNVGIGTTSPAAKLDARSNASGSYGAVIYNTSATGQGLTVRGGSTSSQDALNVQTYDGNTSLLSVQGGGNVGIGTSSPAAKLHAVGNVRSSNGAGTIYSSLASDGVYATGTDLYIFAPTGYKQIFYADNAEKMRLDTDGNLLIGTTSVNAKLCVNNTSQVTDWALSLKTVEEAPGTNAYYFVDFRTSGNTQTGYIYSSGGTTTSYVTSSDYRLKENIAPITGALDKVALLKPSTWSWKSNGSSGQGFIAHELQAVCPDAVSGKKDGLGKDGNPKYQGVDTSFLVATLTAAIQEQQAMIEQLTTRLTALEQA